MNQSSFATGLSQANRLLIESAVAMRASTGGNDRGGLWFRSDERIYHRQEVVFMRTEFG